MRFCRPEAGSVQAPFVSGREDVLLPSADADLAQMRATPMIHNPLATPTAGKQAETR
jgi:hypothetical protein